MNNTQIFFYEVFPVAFISFFSITISHLFGDFPIRVINRKFQINHAREISRGSLFVEDESETSRRVHSIWESLNFDALCKN